MPVPVSCRGTKASGTGPGWERCRCGCGRRWERRDPRGSGCARRPGQGMVGPGRRDGGALPAELGGLRAAAAGPTARQRLRKSIYNFAAGWAVRASAGAISGCVTLSGGFPVGAAAVGVCPCVFSGGGSGNGQARGGNRREWGSGRAWGRGDLSVPRCRGPSPAGGSRWPWMMG